MCFIRVYVCVKKQSSVITKHNSKSVFQNKVVN